MAINSTNFKFNTPDNGTEEDTWGVKLNENWDKIDALLQGTSYTDTDSNTVEKISPDLLGGSWAIDNIAVTSSAAELNKLDGVTASTTELNYIVGATSSLQTQLNGKQAVDAGLTSISGLTTAANNMIYTTGSDTYAVTSLTAAGRALLDDADAAAQRTTLGLGSAATTASTAYATSAQGSTADTALQPSDNISVLTNNSGYITGNQTITLSGDVSGSGTTAITTNIGANKVGVNELNLSEGTSGQFLKTDGSGTISFADAPTIASFAVPNGEGIDFSATSDGAGVDTSSLLDDYEEGSWTPTINSPESGSYASINTVPGVGVTVGSTLYSTNRYTKIGRLVTVVGSLHTTVVSNGSASGNAQITGLPYAPADPVYGYHKGTCTVSNWATGKTPVVVQASVGNCLTLAYLTSGEDHATIQATDLTVHASGSAIANIIQFSITYEV